MAKFRNLEDSLKALKWPLRLTEAGMWAENFWRAFWPLASVVFALVAFLMLGLHDVLPLELVWGVGVVSVAGLLASAIYGALRYRVPSRLEVLARIDASLPGRPIQALMDDQAVGIEDPESAAVWRAHQARMSERAARAQAVPAEIRLSARDPYGLRFIAGIFFVLALLFGSLARVNSVTDMAPSGEALASGPVWEGWVESPRYTQLPTLYLNDIEDTLQLPQGSLITIRLYGEIGALTVTETVSGSVRDVPAASDPQQDFTVTQSGTISIDGPGGRSWQVVLLPDAVPEVAIIGMPDSDAFGETTLPFRARDDYGVEAGEAVVTLDLASVDRRHGLAAEPDARPALTVELPMPIAGSRRQFDENLIDDFSEHPWANLPVTVSLSVLDAAEQKGVSEPRAMVLPGRRFFDPLAAALIEQRRDLLWARTNVKARRAAFAGCQLSAKGCFSQGNG